MKRCDECNCLVCENCDCSVYHLDYQLKHWEEVGVAGMWLGAERKDRVQEANEKEKPESRSPQTGGEGTHADRGRTGLIQDDSRFVSRRF